MPPKRSFFKTYDQMEKKKKKLNTSVLFLLLSVALTQRTVCSNNRR